MWVQRSGARYPGGDGAGVETRHAFSFSGPSDPDNVRFGLLVACNEERLAPGAGFAEHPHRDLEIVTWVVEGELTHEDSTGHRTVIRPGDVQRLSAGGGVRHSERNESAAPLTFVQMWLASGAVGVEPEYEVVRGIADGTPYALARAEAVLHVRRLSDGERTALPDAPWSGVRCAWARKPSPRATRPASPTRRAWRRGRRGRRSCWCGRCARSRCTADPRCAVTHVPGPYI